MNYCLGSFERTLVAELQKLTADRAVAVVAAELLLQGLVVEQLEHCPATVWLAPAADGKQPP